ncbi:hypothetical protein BT69DRAFT_220608 [Atractiella rhizophila]|nr:hypothetical protein BT69DRAFT_220608 [Atractiella rhizophila]
MPPTPTAHKRAVSFPYPPPSQQHVAIPNPNPVSISKVERLSKISKAFQTRLQYARVKIENGWEGKNVMEIEGLLEERRRNQEEVESQLQPQLEVNVSYSFHYRVLGLLSTLLLSLSPVPG